MISVVGLLSLRRIWLGLLALAAFSTPGLADQRITTRFEMFGFARIGVLTLRNRIEQSGERYTITTDYATKGLASVFVDLTTHAEVRGRLIPGSAQPEWFRNDSRRNGTERHSRVDYRPDGAVDAAATPPLAQPMPAAAMRDTVDNLTAYLRLERQLARTGSCALTARVFDGRHAYDLVFADAGRTVLSPAGGLLLAIGAALAQSPPQINRVAMRFEVFGPAGLHVLTNRIEIDEIGERYAVASELTTRGLTGFFLDLADHSKVGGRLTAASALPEAFRSEARHNGEDRHDRVDYRDDGSIDGSASPPPITPITAAQMRGTVDALTAYLLVERRLGRGEDCTLVIPVYEGRRRYDLRYTDRGEQISSPAGGQ